jgi:FixJ family two-component response regulator
MTAAPVIHIVDDDESMRKALQRLLAEGGYQTCAYGSTGEFLLQPLPDQNACLLLDVRLPGPSGLDLQAALQRRGVELPVIFLTGHAHIATSVRAMKAGAVDFLEKPVEPDMLFATIRSVLDREASQRALREIGREMRKRLESFRRQQREVFDRIVDGKLNKEIAFEPGISERTVKTRRAEVMTILDAESVADLVRQAEQFRRLSESD